MRIDLPCCGFKNCKYQFDGNCMDKGRYEKCEYIELALNVLPSAQQDVTDTNVGDAISRQAAIDALNQKKIYRQLDSDRWVISDCLNAIVNLPSAQQCEYWDSESNYCALNRPSASVNNGSTKSAQQWIPDGCHNCVHNPRQGGDGQCSCICPKYDCEQQWIPVSSGNLPEVRQRVLCQCRTGIQEVLRLNEDGDWECVYPRSTYMKSFVIAWMPLPEPFREGSEA